MRIGLVFVFFSTFGWWSLIPPAQAQVEMTHSGSSIRPDDTNQFFGALYTPEATTVRLWAPTAKNVRLLLFDNPTEQTFQAVPMRRDDQGVWSAELHGDMDGKYYLYEVTHVFEGITAPTIYHVLDPYSRGCSANSGRALIYNPRKTDPPGWSQDRCVTLKHNTEAVLYEVHVRDFTINKNSGVADEKRGKYLGMVQPGTKTPGGAASGLDHLKELGLTHVHLLPVFDFAGGDELQKADEYTWYNWGYDPLLYNTPEGSYASDANGTARQSEFKQMVHAFHQNNIGVIMDVVFNHTAAVGSKRESIFDKICPRYYYRMDKSGRYANGTGCGNEFASEKPMARKFILDSVKYWMTEYHIDGFRFDLMGILDRETMLEVYREAKKINPNALIYGEGWQMERVLPANEMMTQSHVRGTGIAAFNDGIRDNIKGDHANPHEGGFAQGAGAPFGGMKRFELNIKGQSTAKDARGIDVFSPNETINYDSAHDDLCLWDKLRLSTPDATESARVCMDKLAAGILLTAQGVPFLHAGDEFLRSKKFNANSYKDNAPDVNPINWALKDEHADVFNFYRGMIALRRAHPAFRMTERREVDERLEFIQAAPPNVMAYVLKNHANGDNWNTILVIYNGNPIATALNVPGQWIIVANDRAAGLASLGTAKNEVRVAPFSLIVAHTDDPWRRDSNR